MTQRTIHTRVNITLPRDTLQLVDRITEKRDRSRFLNEAVRFYIRERGQENLRKLLRKGALQRADRDFNLVQEWFSLENETWRREKNK